MKERRPPDGKLHCSSDLLGPLRHSQLRLAGAPTIESDLVGDIRLMTGTMWHEHFRDLFVRQGLPLMAEVRLDRFLPEGWSGTADWLFWDFNNRCFVLGDLKTTKGSGMYYIERDGVKAEHAHQLSAYYHALVEAKMPVRKRVFVCYLPMDTDSGGLMEQVEPAVVDFEPLDRNYLWTLMEERWASCQDYLRTSPETYPDYNSEALAPPTERTHKLFWDKANGRFDAKLVPDWRTKFCPYSNDLCDCSEQGSTKIGHFMLTDNEVKYVPRKGYENVIPLLQPSEADFGSRRAA